MNTMTPARLLFLLALIVFVPIAGCAAGDSQSSVLPGSPGPAASESCGIVRVMGPNPPTDPAALQAENCFMTAFNACRAAVALTVENRGVDVTSTTVFTIRSGSPCQIDGMTETVLVPSRRVTSSFACSRVSPKDGGLLFVACGRSGDIFVPPPRP